MKKFRIVLFLVVASLGIMLGCTDDPPPPPAPIVGEWNLDAVIFSGLPSTHDDLWNNVSIPLGLWWFGSSNTQVTIDYTFNNDGTFSRRFNLTGQPDIFQEGTWVIDGSTLELDSDDFTFPEEYEIDGDIEDFSMVWTEIVTLRLEFEDGFDTLSDWSYETQERFEAISSEVQVLINYLHER